MSREPRIALLFGGISDEREISIGSGKAAAEAFSRFVDVELMDVVSAALPSELDPERHIVFSTLHGTFGEDGQIQRLMDEAGVEYAGCDAASSALTFDKIETKRVLAEAGVPVLKQVVFKNGQVPNVDLVIDRFGEHVVVKPNRQGSSIGLHLCASRSELEAALVTASEGEWLIEPRVNGREATVAVVDGRAFEIVEIKPLSGRFDFESKYTKGKTEFIVPAPFDAELSSLIKRIAENAYVACGCRDYIRIDFMITHEGEPYVLEINTLPGLKETSLLPMSAAASGLNFEKMLQKLVEPARLRFNLKYSIC